MRERHCFIQHEADTTTDAGKEFFAKFRVHLLEHVKQRALNHSLLGAVIVPETIVATGVATSLYRDYMEREEQRRSQSLVLYGVGTGKTIAGIMLTKGKSSFAPTKSLYFGVSGEHNTCPQRWYETIRKAIMQRRKHEGMDDYQLAKLLGEVLKREKTKTKQQGSGRFNEYCHGTGSRSAPEDDTLISCKGLESKARGGSTAADDYSNGVLILDDMNFELDVSDGHEPFSRQMGTAYSFARSLAEIAHTKDFLVVFMTNNKRVARVLESLKGTEIAPASQFAWTPKRRMRVLAKRFASLDSALLQEYAEKGDMDMHQVCTQLCKQYYRSKLPALACTSTVST